MSRPRRTEQSLDRVFAALADQSRRRMLFRLRKRPLSISELAKPFAMSFAGVAKHIDVLAAAGLIRKMRAPEDARRLRLELQNHTLVLAFQWLSDYREFSTGNTCMRGAFAARQSRPQAPHKKRMRRPEASNPGS